MNYDSRMRRFRAALSADKIDLAFIPISADLQYLTGISREMPNFGNTLYPGGWLEGVFITPDGRQVFTVTRMTATFHMSTNNRDDVRILADEVDPVAAARDVITALNITTCSRIAVGERTWAQTLINLGVVMPEADFVSATAILRRLRVVKDAREIDIMRQAGEITERAYANVCAQIHPGVTELDLMTEVDYQLRHHGGYGPSFTTSMYNVGPKITVDFGNREATWRTPLEPPVALLFDFGAVYEGYCYDFGRTVFLGEPGAEFEKVYKMVLDAQVAGIAALKSGVMSCEQVDAVARQVIADAGYGQHFKHRLGHGIGLDVHEPPFLTAGEATMVKAGMMFTVEPSILIPNVTGARVEDVVVVGLDGGEPLTSSYREMFVVSD